MISVKKSQLDSVLMSMMAFDAKTGRPVAGLLTENVPLSLKRRLQKIQNRAIKLYEELQKEIEEVEKIEDIDERKKQLDILMDEEVKIDAEFVDMKMIEDINTAHNYSFDIIELFAK